MIVIVTTSVMIRYGLHYVLLRPSNFSMAYINHNIYCPLPQPRQGQEEEVEELRPARHRAVLRPDGRARPHAAAGERQVGGGRQAAQGTDPQHHLHKLCPACHSQDDHSATG